jgi:hypothetical protein
MLRQLSTSERAQIQKQYRIPVDSEYPQKFWIMNLDDTSLMPTETELAQLRSYLEYKIVSWYNPSYRDKLLAMSLPYDSGRNTIILCKGVGMNGGDHHEDTGWRYRRATWNHGHVPFTNEADYRPLSLVEILDRCEELMPGEVYEKWAVWKSEHAELFAPEVEAVKLQA